jgi:hypothetical protein
MYTVLHIISQLAITRKNQDATEAWYAKNFGFRRARGAVLPDGKKIIFIKMADRVHPSFEISTNAQSLKQ